MAQQSGPSYEIVPGGRKLGPFWLSPGISCGNAGVLMYGAFSTISLVAFLNFAQPYLFVILDIPVSEQGSLAGSLVAAQELVQVVLAGLIGALSDRLGRRLIYAAGLVVMALSYFVYPLAESAADLFVYRIFYAVGMTTATVMMSTCFAEYTQDITRGRWMGMMGVFNGLGVVLMATVLAKIPLLFAAAGYDPVEAIRFTFWIFGAYILLLSLFIRVGLKAHERPRDAGRASILRQTTVGFSAARSNLRVALGYLMAFASRGDLVVMTTFVSLWVIQAGTAAGMSPGEATVRAGMVFGIAQGTALLWSPMMGYLLDCVPRMTGLCVAFALASTGYFVFGQVDDPLGRWMIPGAMIAGIGESSAIVAGSVLIGQEAPARIRGAVLGTFALCGAVGMICVTYVGGLVFDRFGGSAPFAMMGFINIGVLVMALYVRRRSAQDDLLQKTRQPAAGEELAG